MQMAVVWRVQIRAPHSVRNPDWCELDEDWISRSLAIRVMRHQEELQRRGLLKIHGFVWDVVEFRIVRALIP